SASNSWLRSRTLRLNSPCSATASRVWLKLSRQTSSSGGASEADVKLLAVSPRKPSADRPLTTATADGTAAIASLKPSLRSTPGSLDDRAAHGQQVKSSTVFR